MEGYNLMTSKYYVLKCKKNMKKNLKHFPVGIISLTLFTSFSKVKLLTGRVFKWSKTKYKAVPCSIFDVTFFSFFLYEITPPYTYVWVVKLKEALQIYGPKRLNNWWNLTVFKYMWYLQSDFDFCSFENLQDLNEFILTTFM